MSSPVESLRTEFTADLSPLIQAVRQGSELLRQFSALASQSARSVAGDLGGIAAAGRTPLGDASAMTSAPKTLASASAAQRGVSAQGSAAIYRAGDVHNTFNIQAISEAAVRSQLLPLIEQAYRRGQARPPWIDR